MLKQPKWLNRPVAVIVFIGVLLVSIVSQPQFVYATADGGYGQKAKYVFLFIGDGMAMPQIRAAELFKKGTTNTNALQHGNLALTSLPYQGTQTSHSANASITDSAAAGTALATGHKTNNGVLGMDPTKTMNYTSMAELAKANGMKVGIISSVSLDSATPASFYAHEPTRKNYYEIAATMVHTNFDYFAGGGLLAPAGPKEDRENILELARQNGFQISHSNEEILNLQPNGQKIIAICPNLTAGATMVYEIDRTDQLSLQDLTRKGIEMLNNPNGFFLMVEGGKIDWACHANDAGTAIHDVLAFDNAIAEALSFYANHPNETLIVITGDHETGGMAIDGSAASPEANFMVLQYQLVSFEEFDKEIQVYRQNVDPEYASLNDWIPFLTNQIGLTDLTDYDKNRLEAALAASMVDPKKRSKDENNKLQYGPYEPFSITASHIFNQKAGISWTTYGHTSAAVPVFAQGVGGASFQGTYDNTDIAKKVMNTMDVAGK
ncbi:MAG: Alkaline phosphatase [Firmicutes bacterium]|nr:Alkaline phosphatase [Bacillota bacterium]